MALESIIGLVFSAGMLAVMLRVQYQLGSIAKGMNGLVKVQDDHEGRLRKVERGQVGTK